MAEEDDVVKLNCPIMGNPKPIIEWYQDDQLIHSMWDRERFRINRKTLKIKGVTLADSGVFECKGKVKVLIKNFQKFFFVKKHIFYLRCQWFWKHFRPNSFGSQKS